MKAVFCWAVFGKREAGKEKVLYGAACGRKTEAFCPCGTAIRTACVLVTVFYKKKTHDFHHESLKFMARLERFERPTYRFVAPKMFYF